MSNTRNDIAKRLGLAQPNARPGADQKVMKKPPVEFELEDACWDGYEAVGTKKKDGKTVPNCVPKAKSSRPGAKVKMAVVKDVKIKPGKDEDSRFFTASINGIERQGKVVKDWSRLGGWGWVAYIDGVQNSGGSQTRKTIQEAIGFASEFIKASRPGTKAKFATPEQTMYSELFNFWSDRKTNQASHIPALQALIRKARAMPNWKPLSARVGNKPSLHDLADTQEDSINKIKSSRPGNAAKFATPEQIKEQYKQLKELPKQRLFDMWARETLGRVHNADIKEQDKSNMAVDLIRSRFPRKDYEAAGFRIESSRPGAKAKMAEPLPTRPIGSGKNRYLIYHQAVAEEIEQIKQMRNGIIYLREQLSNAKSDMNGAIASFMKVKEFEDEAKAKAQFQNAENEFKQAKEKVQYYLKQVRFSRPGVKAKFETYPSDEAEPWGQDVPRSAKDLEESIAFWTDYANRLDKGLLAYPKALSKASGYKKESLLRELEWKKSAIKKVKKIVLEYKALLAKLKSNPNMSHINGKGRLIKLQRSVYPAAKRNRLIDPNSINSWEIQRGQKITSAGKGTWAFTDPYGKLVIVPILGTFKEAVAWLNKNGDYKHSNDYYKVQMSRPGVKVK